MKFVPASVSRKVGMAVLKTKKNSPTLLFAAGVVGMGATVVTACRATLKLEEVLDEVQGDLQNADDLVNGKHPFAKPGSYEYTEENHKRDTAVIYAQGALKIGKLYAPSIALGVISIACFTQSHRILTKRNAALTAAYTIVEKSFNDYRKRVVAELGSEKDKEFLYGVEEETVVEKTESGTKKTVVKKPAGPSMYARWFDEYNINWQRMPSSNETFLKAHREYANAKLRSQGYLLLNDVYDALGFEKTKEGCVVGWVYGHRRDQLLNDGGTSDGYVDFGVGDWPTAEDFALGRERSVMLDFNVDGIIYDLI